MRGKIKYIKGNIIFVEAANKLIPIFAVYDNGKRYYPIVPGYASTVHNVMGQTLKHVTQVFGMRILTPAVGYVLLLIMLYLSYGWEDPISLILITSLTVFCICSIMCYYIYKLRLNFLLKLYKLRRCIWSV